METVDREVRIEIDIVECIFTINGLSIQRVDVLENIEKLEKQLLRQKRRLSRKEQNSNNSKATKISEKLGQGTDFTSLANLYNEQQQIETFISRKDVPSSVEKVVFLMDNNQISPCIEAEKKYYFYKVINKFDKEKTDANKIVIVQDRARTAFDNVYEDYSQKVKANLNDALWDDYKLQYSDEIKTKQFFQIFDKNLGDLKKSR